MDNNFFKKSVLATALCAVSYSASAEIFISQYVEGGSHNKAIEIANTGSEAVTLEGYILAKSANGNGIWGNDYILDDVTIGANDVVVFSNSQANAEIQAVTDFTDNGVINHNGDDPIAILNASDRSVHDVIGVMGDVDWGKDVTLVRKSSAHNPSANYSASDWDSLEKDDITNLGLLEELPMPVAFDCKVDGQEPLYTRISDIQGEGDASPLLAEDSYSSSDSYFVKGVVTAVTSSITKGFFLQSLAADSNPKTSEGLFVFTNSSSSEVVAGDVICAYGKVKEYYSNTQLSIDKDDWVKLSEQAVPEATAMKVSSTDQDFEQTLERYEGMLVKTDANLDMRVTRTFGYDYGSRRNNMVLAQGRPNMQPNQLYVAGSEEADDQSEQNAIKRLFVDSDEKAPNGVIPYYPDFARTDADSDGSTEDYIRINDRVDGLEGVLAYTYGDFRMIVTNTVTAENFEHLSPRTDSPELYEGDLRIATFNVLNYFNSPFGGDSNQFGSNRGATTQEDFELQQEKIVQAILRLDADIIGLMEIENNGFGDKSAIKQLLDQVNSHISKKKNKYAFVSYDGNADGVIDANDSVGTDAIAVGVIYRPKAVKLVESRVILMPSQQAPEVKDSEGKVIEDGKNYQRDSLAPTFKVKGMKGKHGNNKLTIAINHFKSKGSKCWEDAAPIEDGGQATKDLDRQGSCENFRVSAAVALGEALSQIDGHKVILGDMNSYAKEDPMLVLTEFDSQSLGRDIRAARNTYIDGVELHGDEGEVINKSYGYINAISLFHPEAWSYSYNDEVGSLDHILVSDSLEAKVVDAVDWHINGGESTLFEYSSKYTGDLPKYADHYRSSDHDPAVLELDMKGGSVGFALLIGLAGFGFVRSREQAYK